jgi:uncharacterized protein (DUF362 family)
MTDFKIFDPPPKWSTPHWDRRRFLKTGGGAVLWMAALGTGLSLPRLSAAAPPPDIAIAIGEKKAAVRAAVAELGGMETVVRPGQKVVIKPNMSFSGGPDAATNTHPDVVKEIALLCREAGAGAIRVLDHPLHRNELCIEGVRSACEIIDDTVVEGLSRSRFFKPTAIPDGTIMRETEVMADVLDADILIAAPVAKSHSSAGVSLSMKGMMGLIWNRGIMHSRFDLHESIVDLATLLTPDLVIIDGSRVLSTNGPSGPGKVLRPDTIIASADMVAADATAVTLFEWYGRRMPAEKVRHIRIAHERGLGRMDIGNLVTRKVTV